MSEPVIRLMYSPVGQYFVFIYGRDIESATPLRLHGEPMHFQSKRTAIEAARNRGLAVDKKGFVSSLNPSAMNGFEGLGDAHDRPIYHWTVKDNDDEGYVTACSRAHAEEAAGAGSVVTGARKKAYPSKGDFCAVCQGRKEWAQQRRHERGDFEGVSPRSRLGTRVRFQPNPASHLLYSNPPEVGEEGSVTTMPGFGKRTYLPGPGGGLLYVEWDNLGVMGVSPNDVEKVSGRGARVGRGRPGQKFSHGDTEIDTTLHPFVIED